MSYAHLTREERYVIAHLKMFKLSVREIARRLNRHHSTISRELKRNGPHYPGGVYWYDSAQARALERKAKPRHQRRRAALRDYGSLTSLSFRLFASFRPSKRVPIASPSRASRSSGCG
ncbi:MAG: helix-turn-helix domain-containing protein [Pseudomonadota bacterium]